MQAGVRLPGLLSLFDSMHTPRKGVHKRVAEHRRPGRVQRHRLEIAVLFLLVSVAVYLWTAPLRQERALKAASLSELEAASSRQPDNPRIVYYLGLRLRDAGQLEAAQAAFMRAAELDADNEDIWLAWAATATAQKESQKAFDILSLFLAKNPRSARAHLALAQCYQDHRAHKRAYEEAAIAAQLNPNDADAWRLVGVNAMAWNRSDEAEEALRRAVALHPNDWRNQLALGDALSQKNDRAGAQLRLREAVRLAPTQAVTHLSLGRFLLQHATTPTEIEAARQSLLQSASLGPDIPLVHLLLGQAYSRQGDWKKARESLDTARQLDARDERIAFELARVYARLGDDEAARRERERHSRLLADKSEIRLLQERILQNKDDPQPRLKLARFYTAHGDYAEAAWQYRQILARIPDMQVARQELAALERRIAANAGGKAQE